MVLLTVSSESSGCLGSSYGDLGLIPVRSLKTKIIICEQKLLNIHNVIKQISIPYTESKLGKLVFNQPLIQIFA